MKFLKTYTLKHQHQGQVKMHLSLFLFPCMVPLDYFCVVFFDSGRNQALNIKYMLELIKRNQKFIKRICHINIFLKVPPNKSLVMACL